MLREERLHGARLQLSIYRFARQDDDSNLEQRRSERSNTALPLAQEQRGQLRAKGGGAAGNANERLWVVCRPWSGHLHAWAGTTLKSRRRPRPCDAYRYPPPPPR